MRHLEQERLAALHETPPTEAEREHLASCGACRAERDAFAELARLALDEGTVGRRDIVRIGDVPVAPLTAWESLRPQLIAEGLLVTAAAPAVVAAPRRTTPWWLNAAAAVALVAGGALLGRFTAPDAGQARVADVPLAAVADTAFSSPADAQAALMRAQAVYESASAWLAVNDTTVHSSDVYRARLAALDDMVATSREALRSAPQDPVLNQYFLSAYSAREATLRQLGGVLPAMQTIDSY
ncbi:MAG: hypothetical protein MUF00_12935 [Gemmatimonadaceae bacterium]|jgi:hypothetical protein|nr:hypothetical protein [Gemmatimonadaceae bacterium]